MRKVLEKEFFNRDTKTVARELLGKFLVRKIGSKEVAKMITETEAYNGPKDQASHAFRGLTKRNQVMFGLPGYLYIYLCYGMYYMLNISTREAGFPAGVLIRGVEGFNGPGKLTRFFKIDKKSYGKQAEKSYGLWFEDRGIRIPKNKIKNTPRIGVNYAGPIWSAKKLRFTL